MKRILVPIDFSIKSHSALALAKTLAIKSKGSIHLLHVLEPAFGHLTSMGEYLHDDLEHVYTVNTLDQAKKELHALRTANEQKGLVITTEVKVGDAYTLIRKVIGTFEPDLVIMGEKGVTDAEEFFLGSITDKTIRNSPCPVITVKAVVDELSFENIVYATDLQDDHDEAIRVLKAFQKLFKSTIHIVKVNTRKDFHNDIDTKVAMEKLADRYGLKKYTLNSYSHEDEEYGIIYFADDKKADLIVMGVHERSGFRRLINGGNLAIEVSDDTYRPVLTFRLDGGPS